MTSLGDMRLDEEVDEMMRETNGDGDVRQCTVEQTDGMPVHAELQSSRHRDVPRHGRGEDALVPWIREHCVEAMTTVAVTHAADQPGVLIHGLKSERQRDRGQQRGDEEEKQREGESKQQERVPDDAAQRQSDVCHEEEKQREGESKAAREDE